MNIVFIGHVDAGKSTIGGQILYLTVCAHCLAHKCICTGSMLCDMLCMWLCLVADVPCEHY